MDKFEEAWKENRHVWESSKNLAKAMYLAGQQSRQAELDQLNEVLDERTKEWLEAIKLGTYFQEAAKPLKDEVEQLNKTLSIKSKFLDDSDAANKFLSEQLEDKNKRIAELELALTQIKSWESHPKNYGIDFGSWGLRDFYRDLADKALRGAA